MQSNQNAASKVDGSPTTIQIPSQMSNNEVFEMNIKVDPINNFQNQINDEEALELAIKESRIVQKQKKEINRENANYQSYN